MTVSSLVVGQKVRIKHGNAWYVAAVEHLGRARVTVVFHLRGDRRMYLRAMGERAEGNTWSCGCVLYRDVELHHKSHVSDWASDHMAPCPRHLGPLHGREED